MSIVPRRSSPKPYKAKKGSLSLSSARKPKKRVDTVTKCKDRIQALLRANAIARWAVCEAAETPEGENQTCCEILQADHIENRGFSNTYADIENIILLCHHHHFYWKKRHPKRWADLVNRLRGKELLERLRREARKSTKTYCLKDWQKAEENLKESLSLYTSKLTSSMK